MRVSKMTKLPDKPSELLYLALSDFEKVEKDPRYVVDMRRWHNPISGQCHVCLAGSILAKTMKYPVDRFVPQVLYGKDILDNKLMAIDCFRRGDFSGGLDWLGLILPSALPAYAGYPPQNDPKFGRQAFVDHICDMIGFLQSEGL